MNKKEKQLAAHLLREASYVFGNRICNDVDEKVWDGWTKKERQQFVKEYYEYNGDPQEYDPNHLELPDWVIMNFLAYKMRKND